ncbi:putative DCC family thiol-disulfide oxidoreductase YuxK [Prosthecobacter fusiformis]|uniref:Putative DCC family thiol-disulfide oxidoreductase YuxK n=1 Tax=Prosthecobacter fusiformis TaxID=48464 RepID=A0A4R7S1G7_9BACT|nr:thiol-disulfide oxidoreductase DCC family protein [Prosthecobacter fusiformis]TDU71346.1 putative DCC family thiol-disulfide oxidoreductase YuxK [Prosthecobacter fusiformis]
MSDVTSPPSHLLLFDGVCNLCDSSVQFVLKHDRKGIIHFASIQSEVGSRLYRQHGLDPEHPHSMLFISPKGVFKESDAALEIAGHLGGLWSLLKIFKFIPRALRDQAYLFVASNRYRWFGQKDACALPRPEWRHRFLS